MMCKADGMWSLNAECTINGLSIILHVLIRLHYLRYGDIITRGHVTAGVDNMYPIQCITIVHVPGLI